MSEKVLLVGIDEAGYGPLLGPLVVSASAFEVPKVLADTPLWTILRSSVSKTIPTRGSRLPIIDSKKLYKPQEGLAKLERSALAMVAAWHGLPLTMRALTGLVSPEVANHFGEYAWYQNADPTLPREADEGSIRIASKMLQQDGESKGVRVAGFWSEILLEGHYNRLVGNTNNKAVVLLGLTLRLLQRVADAYPNHELRFFIDKQGARDSYSKALMRGFEDRRLRVVFEDHEHSEYELVNNKTRWLVSFSQSGETHHMCTALGSILSKYLREVLMGCFNEYWRSHMPGLTPTAGYYTDGQRFLKDITPYVERLRIPRERLVRAR